MIDPAVSSGTKILGHIIDDLYEFIKDKSTLAIKKHDIQRKIPSLVTKIENVRKVKTLWQLDYAVDVETFIVILM